MAAAEEHPVVAARRAGALQVRKSTALLALLLKQA
jgi:hypothetical protein